MDKKINQRAYRVLWSALGVNFLAGMLYIWSIVSKALIENHHWTSSQASLPYTIFTVSFVIAMVIFGKLQDTKGPRMVVTLAACFMGVGFVLSGLVLKPMVLSLAMGVVAGAGVGMATVASSPPAVKWFPPEKKGLVMGVVVAGTGLSAIFYSPLAAFLINWKGVSVALIAIGLIASIPSGILARNLENPPQDEASVTNAKGHTWQEMLRTKDFYKLWTMFIFGSTAGLMITGHIAHIAKVQVGWEAGFVLVILISIFNTLGRFSGGIISDEIGRSKTLKMTFLLQLINLALFSYYKTPVAMSIGVAVVGFCYGSNFSIFPAAVIDQFGLKHYGMNYGILFTAWGVGGVIGPMLAAMVYDRTGDYHLAYGLAAALLAVGIAIGFTLNYEKKET